jgi:hypothetical protein
MLLVLGIFSSYAKLSYHLHNCQWMPLSLLFVTFISSDLIMCKLLTEIKVSTIYIQFFRQNKNICWCWTKAAYFLCFKLYYTAFPITSVCVNWSLEPNWNRIERINVHQLSNKLASLSKQVSSKTFLRECR